MTLIIALCRNLSILDGLDRNITEWLKKSVHISYIILSSMLLKWMSHVFMVTDILGHNTPVNWPICASVNVHVSTIFSIGKTLFLHKGMTSIHVCSDKVQI